MKRTVTIWVFFLFLLTSCTLLLPALMDVSITKVEHQDLETIAIFLRNAEEGYVVKVGENTYDCIQSGEDPEIMICTGPGFSPGEDFVIKFYDGDDPEPIAELSFVAPEYPEELLDADKDGISDADDQCPADPEKSSAGICGCGTPDKDSDADGTPDCNDGCPNDPDKTSPGAAGCKDPAMEENEGSDSETDNDKEKDSDDDGVPDSEDLCQDDPEKTEPEVCGCGVAETDTDGDGIPDCTDECVDSFSDPIGDPCDHDEDDDGEHDFADECPLDPEKTDLGYCGCGFPETDSDGDGVPDCADKCPDDPKKIKPGQCGCGVKDKDTDGDGVADCKDACPTDPNDPVGDPCCHDEDGDTYNDWIDECPYDPTTKHKPCGPSLPSCCP